jgi:hypothetical protein
VAGHSPEARARQAEKQRQHCAALKAWNPSDKLDWLTEETCRGKIQPRLDGVTVRAIASALGISQPYAAEIPRVDTSRIHGIGRLLRGLLEFRRTSDPTVSLRRYNRLAVPEFSSASKVSSAGVATTT